MKTNTHMGYLRIYHSKDEYTHSQIWVGVRKGGGGGGGYELKEQVCKQRNMYLEMEMQYANPVFACPSPTIL